MNTSVSASSVLCRRNLVRGFVLGFVVDGMAVKK